MLIFKRKRMKKELKDGAQGRSSRTELKDGAQGRSSRTELKDGAEGRSSRTELQPELSSIVTTVGG